MNATIILDSGKILDIEYDIEPADGDGWNSPKTGEHIEIIGVSQGWTEVETTDAEDVEILACLWKDMIAQVEDRR